MLGSLIFKNESYVRNFSFFFFFFFFFFTFEAFVFHKKEQKFRVAQHEQFRSDELNVICYISPLDVLM